MSSSVLRPLPGQLPLVKSFSPQPFSTKLQPFFSSRATAPHLFTARKSLGFPVVSLSIRQDSSSSSPELSPPTSREDAIRQAKICLSTTLQKPLNNVAPLPTKKLKRQKQPRFRVEIPVADDSPDSLAQLAFDVFSDLPIKRKGAKPRVLIIWPDAEAAELGRRTFSSSSSSPSVENIDIGSSTSATFSNADMGVFMAPESAMLDQLRSVCDDFYTKPVVIFNPRWVFEEEDGFAASFEVVYSFAGLEVRGLLSKRKGAVFRWVKDGIFSGEGWSVLVEEEGKEEMKVVTRFRKRPSMAEVENVLYNLMAANSPVTKSVMFIKELVSNVKGGSGGK